MKNFVLLGVAGYIAPKHLKAIKETGSNLIASLDKNDSVGILDSYFPESNFFTEYERLDRFLEKIKRRNQIKIDYFSICTPNYLHDSHIRMALRTGANAICEKPLVLNPWNLDALEAIEKESEGDVNTILQLRLHPSIVQLKEKISSSVHKQKYDVDLTYITSRGNWYDVSWKGDESKSGGIATNIGVHFFDMLIWVFGDVQECEVHHRKKDTIAGFLELDKARVRWFLSIDKESLPNETKLRNQKTHRSIVVNGEEIEFSNGFEELHTQSYFEIIEDRGFKLKDSRKTIELIHDIRNKETVNKNEKHFLL